MASLKENKVQSHNFTMCTQHFTHYDAPAHFLEDGLRNDEVPIDSFIGEAVIFDMMHKEPGSYVTASDLKNTGVEVMEGDIAVIRTGWTDKAFGTLRFWQDMIGLSTCAAEWLTNLQAIIEKRFLFGCVLIKLRGTDCAPCRAFAIVGE